MTWFAMDDIFCGKQHLCTYVDIPKNAEPRQLSLKIILHPTTWKYGERTPLTILLFFVPSWSGAFWPEYDPGKAHWGPKMERVQSLGSMSALGEFHWTCPIDLYIYCEQDSILTWWWPHRKRCHHHINIKKADSMIRVFCHNLNLVI